MACSRLWTFARALALASLLSLSLATAAHASWSLDPGSPLAVCAALKQQQLPVACTDGASGMIVAWEDHRDSLTVGADIYVQRITSDGQVATGWPANGFAVCNLAGAQTNPGMISDGSGGVLITWRDLRSAPPAIYVQHVLGTGSVDPSWPVNGRLVCSAPNDRRYATIVTDGTGGAVLAWEDARDSLAGSHDIFATHVLASGAVDPAWPANGLLVCNSPGFKYFYNTTISDGSGGALLAWGDYRGGAHPDLYASHVLAGGTLDPAVPVNGTPVCTAANDQIYPAIAPDGATGAYITWTDYRQSVNDARIYATRLKHNGTLYATWPSNGFEVCGGPASFQYLQQVVSDGSTGAIVAWDDFRSNGMGEVFVQHVLSSAANDPAWPPDGVQASTTLLGNNVEVMAPDGAGGAWMTWETYPVGGSFSPDYLYAGHVLAGGTMDSAWPSAGRSLDTSNGTQQLSQLVSDGAGGLDIAWQHGHANGMFTDDIDASRIAYNGLLAPEPVIVSASDVAGDQGGKLILRWNASWTDTLPSLPVSVYTLWRRLTGTAAQSAIARGAPVLDATGARPPTQAAAAPSPGTLQVTRVAGTPIYWEFLASVPAQAFTGYAYQVTTDADSSASGIAWNDFLVDADLKSGAPFYSSGIDSGYSVDNIAPARPAPFTGSYSAGTAFLHWGPSFEPDLAGYRLYRGTSPAFVPSSANLVSSQPDTGYVDVAGGAYDYKLSAVDLHGNESPYVFVQPTGTAAVLPARAVFGLGPLGPNPVRGEALVVHFSLADPTPAQLELFDVSGRRVAERNVGALGEGPHALDLSKTRTVSPGLYLVRLRQNGRERVGRIAVVE